LYAVFYFSRQFHIPIIGTAAKWILICLLCIIGFFIAVVLLIVIVSLFVMFVVFIRTSAVRRKLNKMQTKKDPPKIRVLNPSMNKPAKKKHKRNTKDVIVDAEYK